MGRKRIRIVLLAILAIIITIGVIFYSEQSFRSAFKGLTMWWEIVVPALLPFFILTEILFGLGVVHFIGTLLEPLMQPLFRIPGTGAFAFAMGLASGYPIGAKITGDLRRNKLCSKDEGERLLVLCNTADPLFMIGAVSIGMFKTPDISFILCACHYFSAIIVGLIFRFYGRKTSSPASNNKSPISLLKQSYRSLIKAREDDQRSFGQIFGDAIRSSINTILLVGGFIIIFSVLTALIKEVNWQLLENLLNFLILKPLGISKEFYLPILSGVFEITNGTAMVSSCSGPLFIRLAIVNGIIAWSGLSVLAQTAAMVEGTDLKLKPYVLARLLHAIVASLMTFFWWKPLQTMATFVVKNPFSFLTIWQRFYYSFSVFLLLVLICFLLNKYFLLRKNK